MFVLVSISNAFPQKMPSKNEIQKLEEIAINKMRKTFDIPRKTQLNATVVFDVIDSTQIFEESPTFDLKRKIENYLMNFKTICYEVFIYDNKLNNVYVFNRMFLGKGKFKKEYYLGKKDDFILSAFFLQNKYDYIFRLTDASPLVNNLILLCFKIGITDLVYLKNDSIKSVSVCHNDTFEKIE